MKNDYTGSCKIKFFNFLTVFWILLIMPGYDISAGPRETLESNLNQVIEVLENSQEGSQEKIEKISAIAESFFDFNEMAGRSLGVYWRRFDENEKKRFVDLYKALLKQTYTDKILSYEGGEVIYKKTLKYGDDRAEVYTSVPTNNGSIPINYRLKKDSKGWDTYDVVIEGVSLIKNYKSQFMEILAKKSVAELFDILEKKVSD